MRGRATGVALSALLVVALVAVVAVAATGSVPRGSNASRAPSDTLLDTLFTLWIVAIVAGGILLVYGLTQRRAIAKQVASGRYQRFSVIGWIGVVCFTVVAYWGLRRYRPAGQGPADEPIFGIPVPDVTTPTDTDPARTYEPGLSWPVVVVLGLVVVAAIAYLVAARRGRTARDPRIELARDLAGAVDDALDDLRAEADLRAAIIAAYARLERVLAAAAIPRRPSETPDEYLARVLGDLSLTPEAIGRLTELFKQAKFSHHAVDSAMKENAIAALGQVRDELRSLREEERASEARRSEAATS